MKKILTILLLFTCLCGFSQKLTTGTYKKKLEGGQSITVRLLITGERYKIDIFHWHNTKSASHGSVVEEGILTNGKIIYKPSEDFWFKVYMVGKRTKFEFNLGGMNVYYAGGFIPKVSNSVNFE